MFSIASASTCRQTPHYMFQRVHLTLKYSIVTQPGVSDLFASIYSGQFQALSLICFQFFQQKRVVPLHDSGQSHDENLRKQQTQFLFFYRSNYVCFILYTLTCLSHFFLLTALHLVLSNDVLVTRFPTKSEYLAGICVNLF